MIALGLVFAALLAFQVPRTLKMLHGSAPASASSTPAAPAAPAPAPAAAAPTAGKQQVVAEQSAADSIVVNADLQPAPLSGQLADLTTFQSKDPFVQQESATAATAAAPAAAASPESAASPASQTTAKPAAQPAAAAPTPATASVTGAVPPTAAVPRTAPVPAPAAPAPTTTVLSVNGIQESVNTGSDFPAADPLFHLVSLTTKSGKISIAGGSLSTGAATVTIQLGKPTTLMNTADGTRYVIVLVSIGGSTAAPTATATQQSP